MDFLFLLNDFGGNSVNCTKMKSLGKEVRLEKPPLVSGASRVSINIALGVNPYLSPFSLLLHMQGYFVLHYNADLSHLNPIPNWSPGLNVEAEQCVQFKFHADTIRSNSNKLFHLTDICDIPGISAPVGRVLTKMGTLQ